MTKANDESKHEADMNLPTNMSDASSEQKLDRALRFLSNDYYDNTHSGTSDFGFVKYDEFEKNMAQHSLFKNECLSMVLYLSRDNKIDILPIERELSGKPPTKLRLNFDGFTFHNNGGYRKAIKDREDERKRIIYVDDQIVSSNHRLNWGTWTLAGITFFLLIIGTLDYLDKHPHFWERLHHLFCG